jgi:hypothetical protein
LWQDLSPVDWLIYHLGEGYFMFPAVWLVSRSLTEKAGKWNEELSYNDDGEYFSRVVAASEKVCFVSDANCYHRAGNISSLSNTSLTKKAYQSLNLSVSLCVDYLLKLENSERTRKASVDALMDVIDSIYEKDSEIVSAVQKRINELGGNASNILKSRKFTIAEKLFGFNTATSLKSKLWNMEILLKRSLDKLYCVLSGENS